MKKMSLIEAIHYIETHSHETFAFRGDDYIPAKKFRPSRYHGDDPRAHKLVGGVCSIGASSDESRKNIASRACVARCYGEHVFLLKFDRSEYGEDRFEYILQDHQIIGYIGAEEFVQVGSVGFDGTYQTASAIPEREDAPEQSAAAKLSFEAWCVQTFNKLWPCTGIFEAQYAAYCRNKY